MSKTFYFVGDLNINLLYRETHSKPKDFINLLLSYGMVHLINTQTSIPFDTASLFDHISTNCLQSKKRKLKKQNQICLGHKNHNLDKLACKLMG